MPNLIKGFRNKDGEILSLDYSTISIERDADNNPVTDINLKPEDIGAASKETVEGLQGTISSIQANKVPITRKVNGKVLSSDITLNASDVSARPSTWTPTAEDVGASKAITGITRSGTTFTATHIDGTTSTFTQQDNNTTYTAASATPKAAGTATVGTSAKYAREDHVHPLQTTVSGNAGTATKFASAQSVALTGDVTGSASSQAGWSIATTLANSGVTAGTYGPSAAVTGSNGAKMNVPEITVDAKGRVTKVTNRAYTAVDNNTTYTFATGSTNGTISVTPSGGSAQSIAVKGLGTAAYTASTAYATAAQGTKADNALPITGGTISAAGTTPLNINNTNANANVQTYWQVGGANKASVGYYNGIASVANEKTTARIGVIDDGTPQYWSNSSGSKKYTLLHAGNYGSQMAGGTISGSSANPLNLNSTTANNYMGFKVNDIFKACVGYYNNQAFLSNETASTGIASIGIAQDGSPIYRKNWSASTQKIWVSGDLITGAVWNDYAEYREADTTEPGRVVCEYGDDTLKMATERLQPGANVVSDTFGFAIGETETAKTPIAVAGRVLVYTFEDRNTYQPGDAVCAAPNGTVSKMSREEIINYPERIVGTVSAVPTYEIWGENDVSVNGRIWIKVR